MCESVHEIHQGDPGEIKRTPAIMANLQGNMCHTLRNLDEKWWKYLTCIGGMLFLPATRFDFWSGNIETPPSI